MHIVLHKFHGEGPDLPKHRLLVPLEQRHVDALLLVQNAFCNVTRLEDVSLWEQRGLGGSGCVFRGLHRWQLCDVVPQLQLLAPLSIDIQGCVVAQYGITLISFQPFIFFLLGCAF